MSEGYEALRHGAAFLDVSARGRIVARGRDRARLLHNLTTNEVKKLTPGSGCYAFLLSPQGRIQADLHLLCFDDRFLIETESELREKVFQHIRRYIIADQVELEDVTAQTVEIALEGPTAAALLAALNAPIPGEPYSHLPWDGATIAAMSLTGQPGFRIFGDGDLLQQNRLRRRGGRHRGRFPPGAHRKRQAALRRRHPRDLASAGDPADARHQFQQGLLPGTGNRGAHPRQGHVNKKLVRIELNAAEAPAAGTKLTADGAEAGEITSAVYSPDSGKVLGLAYVRTPHANPGTELHAGDARAIVG